MELAAMEPLVEYYRGTNGEADNWAEYRRGMERERSVLIRITLTTAGPGLQG